jgi:hypothetical protein
MNSTDPTSNGVTSDGVTSRAHLLPEEEAAGSADPQGQAAAILAESEERTEHPEETGAASSQTIPEIPES